jgi:hypothetical protein
MKMVLKKSVTSFSLHFCTIFLPFPFLVLIASRRKAAMDDGLHTTQYHCIPAPWRHPSNGGLHETGIDCRRKLAIFESLLDFEV